MDGLFILLIALVFFLRSLNIKQAEKVEDFDEASMETKLNPSFYKDEDAFSRYAYELGFNSISNSDSGTGFRLQDITSNASSVGGKSDVSDENTWGSNTVQDMPNVRVDIDGDFLGSFNIHEATPVDKNCSSDFGEFNFGSFD